MQNKDYKILFISFFNGEAIGVRILHSILHHKEYNTKLLFLKVPFQNRYGANQKVTEKEFLLLENYIKDYKPDLIALSLVSSSFGIYKKIHAKIKPLGDYKILKIGRAHV